MSLVNPSLFGMPSSKLIASGDAGGTVAGVSGKPIYMIKAYANGSDGTVAFNGQTITVRSGVGWDIDFRGQVTASTSVVFSASIDYLIVWAS